MQMVRRLKDIPHMKYGRIIIDFAIITLLAVVIFRRFLFTREWPAGGDVLGWISREYLFGKDFRWLYTWRPCSFGFNEGINLIDFFLMLIYSVCRDASATIKIFMFSSFLMAGFTVYAFAYHYSHRHTAALSASMIYCFNQWIFSQLTEAHIDILFSYASVPLVFLLLDRVFERKRYNDIFALALTLSIFATSFHPECIVIYGFFLLMFIVFYVLPLAKSENFRIKTKHLLKTALPVAVVCFLLSAFSLLPFMFNVRAPYYSPTYVYPIEDAINWSYKNITDAFTLRAIESWGYLSLIDIYTDLGLPDFPIHTLLLLIFLLAFCTVFLRRNRHTTFFAFSGIISIFMAKGPYPPFGYIFTWAWFNIPYFAVFRATSRWVMMSAFSHAFLVSVLVSILASYLEKRKYLKAEEIYLKAKAKISEKNEARDMHVSVDILNKAVKNLNKFLYYSSLLLLVFALLSGFLSCFYFFSQGLQVYTPPQKHIEPYNWLAEQPGDYKVITVSNSPSEWVGSLWQESDFASVGMLTGIGWGHDIGYDSSFIHDKPTLQDGGWHPLARTYIDHMRFRLVRQSLTDNFLKMLGPFNYKYVVLPEYLANNTRDFFLHQKGYHIVHNQSSLILQNEYYASRIFVTSQYVYIVGGLESFSSLCKIETFNLNETSLIFAHQTNEASPFSYGLFNSSEALVFVNSDIVDATMLSLRDQVTFIKAADYGVLSINHTKYWTRASSWRQVGGFVWGGDTLTTSGKNSISIPFKVNSNGIYDVWIRIAFADNRGKLSVVADGASIGKIQPLSNYWSGLRWVNITRLDLRSGEHVITLTNDGMGYNDVDAIAIVKPSLFQSRANEVLDALQAFPGKLIHVLEAESAFTYHLPAGWSVAHSPYNGFMLHTEGIGSNVSPEGKASASSFGTWANVSYEAHGANDGNINTRWASKPPEMPQWLQIEWPTPQELVGVRIVFERAFAKNYVIQTWDGTNWINQVNVTGNTFLERLHSFQQPVQTTKLRIYVTSAPAYDMVSIFELESYTIPSILTKVSVPREGRYMFALRLASGPDYGTLHLKVNDATARVWCNSSIPEFKWYQVGPVHLHAGDQTITISGRGKIDFDQMIIYSLTDGEDALSVNDLFKPSSAPQVSYERINPCEYKVHVKNSEGPFLLVFSDSYHPMWRAYIGDVEVAPIITYSLVNGFFINKTGDFDITLYFTGQTYANIGLTISAITLIAVVAYLTIRPIISRVRKKSKAEAPRVPDRPS